MEKSFNEQGLRIYFVKQSRQPPKVFTEAFQLCEEKLITPQKISAEECMELELDKKVVLVLENFQGALFNKLVNSPCTVLGAPCVLECLRQGEPNPDCPHPVFSLAMKGLRVSVSGFTVSQKDDLANKVRYMGGTFEKDLHDQVTHLVVLKTNTFKYQIAADRRIPVMLESWIHESWEANQTKHHSATEEPLCSLKCRPFQNLSISITQFQKAKREKIRTIIENNGGHYSPEMTSSDTDVLVVASASGEKFQHAIRWKIPCVSESWISESAKAGYSLKFTDFAVQPQTKTSTPDRDTTHHMMDISGISSIVGDNKKTCVNETIACASFAEPLPPERKEPPATPEKEPDAMSKIMKIPVAEVRKAGLFLDGCKVYVSGGTQVLQDKLRKMLNSGGATRFDDISESLTHILLAGASLKPSEAKELTKLGRRPPVVPLSWLLKSVELKHPAEAVGPQGTEPPSPLSKRGMQMFETKPILTISPRTAKSDLAVVQQYMEPSTSGNSTIRAATSMTLVEDDDEELARPLATFQGLRVQLKGLSKPEAASARATVEQLGGQIVFAGPDYVIAPCLSNDTVEPNEVNVWWLEQCLEKGEPVSVEYYHRPIGKQPQKPLKGVVLTISTYTGIERSYLSNLSTELGALYQEVFAKKATSTANRSVEASTHLICPTAEGSKYVAAVKWQLPAVTKEWLLKCAETSSHVPEDPYLLNRNVRMSTVPSPAASILSTSNNSIQRDTPENFVTPVRPAANTNFATPFTPFTPQVNVNTVKNDEKAKAEDAARIARLSITSFRKEIERMDPDYMSTPETPYGSVVKDDPSPNTRKKWKRYLNSIPDSNKPSEAGLKLMKEKIPKRLRIEDMDEEEEEEEQIKKKKKDSIDSDVDDELLKNYASQKAPGQAEEAVASEHEKENQESPTEAEPEARERIFMVTGVVERDMENMSLVVSKLGGRMSSLKFFDQSATHLVTPLPSRSEKLLASMAAGLWVVHPQYLLQSAKSGRFVPEEDYEWGNEAAEQLIGPLVEDNQRAKDLAASCHRWRLKAATDGGAFKDFTAVLVGAPHKTTAFERMIVAGGGQVVPYGSDLKGVTHCFVEASKVNSDLSAIRNANVPCYNPIFLNDFLINEKVDPKSSAHQL